MYYGGSNLTNVCSTSNVPRITGETSTSTINLGVINNCSNENDGDLKECGLNRFCSDYDSNSSNCNNRSNSNTDDGPCIWIVNEAGNSGSCEPYDIFNCSLIINAIQCEHINGNISGNLNINGNCFWDETSGNGGTCVMNGTETPRSCSNNDHYEVIGSKCVLKSCSNRRRNDSEEYKCGPGHCYFDINKGDEGGCSERCMNEDHFEGSDLNHECVEKGCENRTMNSSNIKGCGSYPCFFDGIGGYKCRNECTEGNLYEGVNGKCVLKDCEKRTPDSSLTRFGCGLNNNCFLDVNENDEYVCVSSCNNERYYEVINGKCVLKHCKNITAISNEEEDFRCGKECVYDSSEKKGKECQSNCKTGYKNISGICVIDEDKNNDNNDNSKTKNSNSNSNSDAPVIILLVICMVGIIILIIIIVIVYQKTKRNKKSRSNGDLYFDSSNFNSNSEGLTLLDSNRNYERKKDYLERNDERDERIGNNLAISNRSSVKENMWNNSNK
jgi:hypothetical protein